MRRNSDAGIASALVEELALGPTTLVADAALVGDGITVWLL
jgi:hypothetical protein